MKAVYRRGDKGPRVILIQKALNFTIDAGLKVDGDFGRKTEAAVMVFQKRYQLEMHGVVDRETHDALEEYFLLYYPFPMGNRFVIFVDAGHGSPDDEGIYTTAGKRMYHQGEHLHRNGWYYEGYENRLIAEAFIEECTKLGIMCIRTYHPYKDTSLSDRIEIVKGWLNRGYYGYMHSFHSNAISLKNKKEKLEKTRGFIVFNTRGDNFSDEIATQHFKHVKQEFEKDWILREDMKDGDPDYEANFKILRETDLKEFKQFGAILDEWGFHTSRKDTLFITNPKNRIRRVQCCVKTALWVQENIQKLAV